MSYKSGQLFLFIYFLGGELYVSAKLTENRYFYSKLYTTHKSLNRKNVLTFIDHYVFHIIVSVTYTDILELLFSESDKSFET